jgi:hypothetical protein
MLVLADMYDRMGDGDAAYTATWQAWKGNMKIYGEHGIQAPEIEGLVKRRLPRF